MTLLPITKNDLFLTTRVSLSLACFSVSGMLALAFIYCLWGFAEDISYALAPEEEVTVEEAVDLFPHIQPITVTAKKRTIK